MYVKVRTVDGKSEKGFEISKLISVEDFKVRKNSAHFCINAQRSAALKISLFSHREK